MRSIVIFARNPPPRIARRIFGDDADRTRVIGAGELGISGARTTIGAMAFTVGANDEHSDDDGERDR
ncbi:hypothetical protein EB74_20740 [Mycobacterium sp. SWH-M5]|nr:hypothetical protein EB74_20740 [Mycobacterium sp. SWH-M5]